MGIDRYYVSTAHVRGTVVFSARPLAADLARRHRLHRMNAFVVVPGAHLVTQLADGSLAYAFDGTYSHEFEGIDDETSGDILNGDDEKLCARGYLVAYLHVERLIGYSRFQVRGQYNIEEDAACAIMRRDGPATPEIRALVDPDGEVRATLRPCASVCVELGTYDVIVTTSNWLHDLEEEWEAACR